MIRIKEIRKNSGLTQKEFAEKLNLDAHNVGDWERNKCEPSIFWLSKIADVFGVSIDYLVGREDDFGNVNVVGAELSAQEQEVLSLFRHLGPFEREAMLIQMKALKESNLESIKK